MMLAKGIHLDWHSIQHLEANHSENLPLATEFWCTVCPHPPIAAVEEMWDRFKQLLPKLEVIELTFGEYDGRPWFFRAPQDPPDQPIDILAPPPPHLLKSYDMDAVANFLHGYKFQLEKLVLRFPASSLWDIQSSEHFQRVMSQLPSLTSVRISGPDSWPHHVQDSFLSAKQFTHSMIDAVSTCNSIVRLELSSIPFCVEDPITVCFLEEVLVTYCKVQGAFLESFVLARPTKLLSLDIIGTDIVTETPRETGIVIGQAIARHPSLNRLEITSCWDETLCHASIEILRGLDATECNLTSVKVSWEEPIRTGMDNDDDVATPEMISRRLEMSNDLFAAMPQMILRHLEQFYLAVPFDVGSMQCDSLSIRTGGSMTDKSSIALAQSLSSSKIQELWLTMTEFTGWAAIAAAASKNPSVRTIGLRGELEDFNEKTILQCLEVVCASETLQRLEIHDRDCLACLYEHSAVPDEAILKLFASNKSLEYAHLSCLGNRANKFLNIVQTMNYAGRAYILRNNTKMAAVSFLLSIQNVLANDEGYKIVGPSRDSFELSCIFYHLRENVPVFFEE